MPNPSQAISDGRPRVSVGDLLENKPPHDTLAEESLLGSILLRPDVCDDAAMLVRPEDFFHPGHQAVYETMLSLHNSQNVVDVAVLIAQLKTEGKLDQIGGPAGIANFANVVPNAAHARYYANIVAAKATYRRLIDACTQILSEAYSEQIAPDLLINQAEQRVFDIVNARDPREAKEIRSVLHDLCDLFEARMRGEETDGVVPTGYTELDLVLGRGLHESELIILAARPSMGKTALALNIAEHVAMNQNKGVLFVSLEMAARELGERLVISLSKINGHRLRNGTLSEREFQKVVEQAGRLGETPLLVDDSPSRNVTEISAAARRAQRRHGLGLIVIDYLQLIEPDNANDSRQEQVARIARRLKGMARDLKVPVLCLAQVNRQAADAREHRPRLSHLRESGAIEQDADVVMFIHRDAYFRTTDDSERDDTDAEVIVAKQRNGPVETIHLVWKKENMRFENRAQERFSEFDAPMTDADEPF